MAIINMFEYEEVSYRRQLKSLYRELDETTLSYELGTELRKNFFKKMRARFIYVCSLKRDMSLIEALNSLEISNGFSRNIESDLLYLTDRQFFLLVTFLGCAHEISIFIEKIEKAMTPGLREDRRKLEATLKKYGIRFADSEDKHPN